MSASGALVRLVGVLDGFLERSEPTPWGAVVTDARLPLIYDANYARVERDASLDEVEAALLPALERSGARFVHVVSLDPHGTPNLVRDMRLRGRGITLDTVMRTTEVPSPGDPTLAVLDVQPGPELWAELGRSLPEFGITDPETIDQVVRWQREVLAPHGKRWVAVTLGGRPAGLGSLFVHEDAAYVDDVVTMPDARRRGVARAIVRHLVAAAMDEGARETYLLADEPGPIRLYERLGFEAVGEVVGVVRPAL